MKITKQVLLIVSAVLVSFPAFAQDDDGDSGSSGGGGEQSFVVTIKKKQENKYKNRWTLANWFETQRKTRMQNQWLAANTQANNYEFFLGYESAVIAERVNELPDPTRTYRSTRTTLAAYATIVGLEGRMVQHADTVGKGYDALFHFRLFGSSVQSTNITLSYGIRNREADSSGQIETIQNTFPQASLTLYLTNHFGIEGVYRNLGEAESNLKNKMMGNVTEATAFIDFSFVRPYGTWIRENMTVTTAAGVTGKVVNEGIYAGLRLFF